MRLEVFSHEEMANFCREIMTSVSDYGVEHFLSKVEPLPISELLPWFTDTSDTLIDEMRAASDAQQPTDDVANIPEVFEDPAVPMEHEEVFEAALPGQEHAPAAELQDAGIFEDVPAEPLFDMTHLLDLPGSHHLLDNATKGLDTCMAYYEDAVNSAIQVCNLVRRRSSREKLLARCFGSEVGHTFHEDLLTFKGQIHKGRWGTLMFSVPELLRVERILRWGWNLRAFVGEEHSENEDSYLATQVDGAVTAPFWWGWLRMFESICKVMRQSIAWIDSCSCHGLSFFSERGVLSTQLAIVAVSVIS